MRTRPGGPVGVLRNRAPAEFWVTFWVTVAGSAEPLAAVGTRARLGLSKWTWSRASGDVTRLEWPASGLVLEGDLELDPVGDLAALPEIKILLHHLRDAKVADRGPRGLHGRHCRVFP